MKKTAIVTDSNSGITQLQAKELGISVLPMPVLIDGEQYLDDVNISQDEFYRKLSSCTEVSTSQPSIGSVMECWDTLLNDYDEIVHIPMSSGLSASYQSAVMLAQEYSNRVQIVNNQRISVTLRQSVLDAATLSDAGWGAIKIKEYLESVRFDSSIYIMLETLEYIKRGGRITAAGAAIGTILNIKPVLQIQGDKLDSYAKVRGSKQGRKVMIEAMSKDFNGRFSKFSSPEHMWLQVAYGSNEKSLNIFKNEVEEAFPGYNIYSSPLPLSVACHIGPGALAIACCKKLDYRE